MPAENLNIKVALQLLANYGRPCRLKLEALKVYLNFIPNEEQ